MRKKVASLIDQLAIENPKVPSNMLHALQSLKPSQLMDQNFWNFKNLEDGLETTQSIQCEEVFNVQEFELEDEKI